MNFHPIPREASDFQQTLSAAEIAALCERAFGTTANILQVRELPSGLFNSTYKIGFANGSAYVLRVSPVSSAPVFTHEKFLLQREHCLQPYLAPVSEFVPQTIMVDFTRRLIDRDYVFQTFLPGELWDEVEEELSTADTAVLWQQMAALARKIHQVTGTCFGLPYPESAFPRWSAAVIHIVEMMLADFPAFDLPPDEANAFLETVRANADYLDEITTPRLLHGDLWPKNVLIDRSASPPRIVGLLDAERGFWGDPLAEWVFYHLNIPDIFWQEYGRQPQTSGTLFRQLAYDGMFTIQGLLESTRFGWDVPRFLERIAKITRQMQEIRKYDLREMN